jgi:hypothetical protein
MADTNRDTAQPGGDDRSELEPEHVRSPNDEDQSDNDARERTRERGYEDSRDQRRSPSDEQSTDTDPDSAFADVDRDDSVEDI